MSLPTLLQFKEEAKALKIDHNTTHSKALELLAQKYGYKNYNSIKPMLQVMSKIKKTDYDYNVNWQHFLEELLRNSLGDIDNKGVRYLTEYSYFHDGPVAYSRPIEELYESLMYKAQEMVVKIAELSFVIITNVELNKKDKSIKLVLNEKLSEVYNNYDYKDKDSFKKEIESFVKKELQSALYSEATEDNVLLMKKPSRYLIEASEKYPLIHLYILIKNYKSSGYYIIQKDLEKKLRENGIRETIRNLELLFGFKIELTATKHEFIIYWNKSIKLPVEKNLNVNIKENKFFCFYSDGENYSKQAMIKNIHNDKQIEYFLFEGVDMVLSDDVFYMSIEKAKKEAFFVKTDRDMRMMHKLIYDISNREDFDFFNEDKSGLFEAATLVNSNIKLVEFILSKLYGYSLDYI